MQTVHLTQFFPWTFILHLIRSLITFNIVHTLLKDKHNIFVTFASIILLSMAYSYVTIDIIPNSRNTEAVILILYYVFNFAIICFTSYGSILQKIMAVLFSYLSFTVAGFAFFFIAGLISKDTAKYMISTSMPLVLFLAYILFAYAFSFISVMIIKLFSQRKSDNRSTTFKYAFFLLFPVTHIFGVMQEVSGMINIYSVKDNPTLFTQNNFENYSLIFSIICFSIDFSLFFIIDHLEKLEITNNENQKKIMQNKLDYYQVQLQKQENASFRKIKHDYINITNTAIGLIEIGQPDKAVEILSKVNDDMLNISGFSICSNETVNTIIYAKTQQAKAKGIELIADIDETAAININDYDLCRILCNIIDNAVNATELSDSGKLCKIDISINNETLTITGENNFNPKNKNKTKKSDLHGNGIGIIKEIVLKYDGNYSAKQENNIWYTKTIVHNIPKADSATPPPNFGLSFN